MRKIGLLVLLALCGCGEAPVSTGQTNNPNVPVALLFEHDGCKVFRFWDAGRHHYYVTCRGSGQHQTFGTETCGRNCTRPVNVTTAERGG
jgi:hypothetical protein